LFDWINDREQILFNAAYRPIGEMNHRAWFESVQDRPDIVIFGIHLISRDQLIGSCQLRGIDPVHRGAELQIRVGEVDERGRG
jgi:RimJ/RimL family protein N-acetyltransferase